jgi:signal transduction histidine kinase
LRERISVPNTGDEVQLLAETMNGMLTRIEDGFQQVRRFTADASHELRTPVAIVRAAAEIPLLRRSAPERVYREALERILRESERSSTLLEDLLLLSRADAGAEQIDQESIDLGKSLTQACAQLAPLVEQKGLRLHMRGPEQTLWIRGNQEHLRRLWLILLDNAFKYTTSGGAVEVSVGSSDGRTYCAVTDSGIGIAPGDLSRIFERFYRVDKARTRSHGGTGLGLAIAHEIAKLHDAAIEVESELGRGATFRVSFPSVVSAEKIPGAVRTAIAS